MNKRYIVDVEGVPASPSPISNAVVVGNQCWISGQLSVGVDTGNCSRRSRTRLRALMQSLDTLPDYRVEWPAAGFVSTR